ncbi:MFS transporter [Martelella endophytica]|uniref:Major facilitator transporter n=1 Tax=Martelella endophytica TaxID=1486262 RepID=A0A0D5LV89_MAREN|nr:MFS transporter [Martelella endophytica]AJY47682.1 major facilitator transporter [Martelella endophytica]
MSDTLSIASPIRARSGFWIMMAGSAVMMATASAPSPFYPVLKQELGFSSAMMTAIFAIYAVALLLTLLIAGSLSDHIGRRPVLSAGFFILGLSALIFATASDVTGLLVARVIQGIGCGLLLSTLPATIVDLEPAAMPGLAAICNAVLPLGGLAIGSLAAGLVMDFGGAPKAEVFGGIVGMSLVFVFIVWLQPETAPRHEGLLRSLTPRLGVPPRARGAFWRGAPAIFAGWATGGLYLSLGPAIVSSIFGHTDFVLQGLVVTLMAGGGAAATLFATRHAPRRPTLIGASVLAIGTVVTLIAIAGHLFALYLAALAAGGAGFGACFYGVMRTLGPLAAPDERSELFASLFTLSYLAFGVPAVLAGLALPIFGLDATVIVYGGIVALMAAAAALFRKYGTHD